MTNPSETDGMIQEAAKSKVPALGYGMPYAIGNTLLTIFGTVIVLMLVGMTVWELKSPTLLRKGFLPIPTTRGDRLFIGLLSAAYLNLAFVAVSEKMIGWFGLEQEPSIWISFVASMALLALVMKEG